MADGSAPTKRGPGRPSVYSPDIAQSICEHIAEGKSVISWVREVGSQLRFTVSYTTIMNWLKQQPEFLADYMRAREDSADADADMMSDLRDRILSGEIDPQAGRVAMDAIKWSTGKRNPKRYGDRVAHVGADGGAIQIEDKSLFDARNLSPEHRETLKALILAATAKSLEEAQGQFIEGECRALRED